MKPENPTNRRRSRSGSQAVQAEVPGDPVLLIRDSNVPHECLVIGIRDFEFESALIAVWAPFQLCAQGVVQTEDASLTRSENNLSERQLFAGTKIQRGLDSKHSSCAIVLHLKNRCVAGRYRPESTPHLLRVCGRRRVDDQTETSEGNKRKDKLKQGYDLHAFCQFIIYR